MEGRRILLVRVEGPISVGVMLVKELLSLVKASPEWTILLTIVGTAINWHNNSL